MNLRELLQSDFGVEFPISGGIGNSIDKPVVIERQDPNDYVSIEYGIVRCLCLGRGVEWELVRQTILKHKGRTIDQIKKQTKQTTDNEVVTQTENYYFDITDCF